MQHRKFGPRAEYRQQEILRINASPNLAEKYRDLKCLTVNLVHYSAEGLQKTSEVKYTVNLAHAKSVFSFTCPNSECVGGDFDLSDNLAHAVATRQTTITGELCCQGWQSKTSIGATRCHNLLRYTFTLEY